MKTTVISTLSIIVLFTLIAPLFHPRVSTAQQGGSGGELISQLVVDRPSYQSSQTFNSTDVRINLDPNESASIDLQLTPGSGIVRLLAPNGGSINNQGSHLEVDTTQQGREINFSFTAGGTRGRYTVEISEGLMTRILEFWVGPESPLSQPGPDRTFPH